MLPISTRVEPDSFRVRRRSRRLLQRRPEMVKILLCGLSFNVPSTLAAQSRTPAGGATMLSCRPSRWTPGAPGHLCEAADGNRHYVAEINCARADNITNAQCFAAPDVAVQLFEMPVDAVLGSGLYLTPFIVAAIPPFSLTFAQPLSPTLPY